MIDPEQIVDRTGDKVMGFCVECQSAVYAGEFAHVVVKDGVSGLLHRFISTCEYQKELQAMQTQTALMIAGLEHEEEREVFTFIDFIAADFAVDPPVMGVVNG